MKQFIRKTKNTAHHLLALSANLFYGFPSRKMIVVGITGTDGKTTTASLIYHILKEDGKKVALISTLGAVIDGVNYDTGFHVTTPSPFAIQKYLKIAKKKNCTHVILEVTSHALDQFRVWGIPFQIGVLTNITHEHLDYHGNYKNYVKAKLILLQNSAKCIVNSSGEWFEYIKKEIPKSKLFTYSLDGKISGDLSIQNMPFKIKTSLIGDFNLENILAATLTANMLGVTQQTIDNAIQSFKSPVGRQQIIKVSGKGNVMIDFAHTPNAFEKILPEVKKNTNGYLVHVFGCAGKRDVTKRPEMGKASAEYADIIILTGEDPRGEDIFKINNEIIRGIENFTEKNPNDAIREKKTLFQIGNRKDAINFALSLFKDGDTVLITGKGHEQSINYGKGEEAWSDQKAVEEYIDKS